MDALGSAAGALPTAHTIWWRASISLAGHTTQYSSAHPLHVRPRQAARDATVTGTVRTASIGTSGDFNNDGLSDILVATAQSGTVQGADFFLGGTGLRSRNRVIEVSQPTLDLSRAARLGDLDGDGYEEFGLSTGFPGGTGLSGSVYVVPGSAGTAAPVPVAVPPTGDGTTAPAMAAVMDGDGDGNGEFAVASPLTGEVRFYRGLGGARAGLYTSFAAATVGPDSDVSVATAGDFNGDGKGDFVVGHPSLRIAELFITDDLATGGFVRVPLPSSMLRTADRYGISVAGGGDLNGDGYSDVAVAAPSGLMIFYGGATGIATSYAFPITSPCGARGWTTLRIAMVGDIDGDGADELVATYVGACLTVLRAPLTGSVLARRVVQARALYAGATEATFGGLVAASGDYDGDGLADFSVAVPSSIAAGSVVKVFFGDGSAWAETATDAGATPFVLELGNGVYGFGFGLASTQWDLRTRLFPRAGGAS